MGYGLIKTIVPANIMKADGGIGLCVTMPNEHILVWQAFAVEFFATSALIWFCCGIWDPRNAHFQDCTSLKFGLAVAGLAAVTVCTLYTTRFVELPKTKSFVCLLQLGSIHRMQYESSQIVCPGHLEWSYTISMGSLLSCRYSTTKIHFSNPFLPLRQIYWTAPLSAAVTASTLYKYVFRREPYELHKNHNWCWNLLDRKINNNVQLFVT